MVLLYVIELLNDWPDLNDFIVCLRGALDTAERSSSQHLIVY